MSSNNYASADHIPPKTGPFWDPLGEYEPHDTVYTLLVFTPNRPSSSWLPDIFTRQPIKAPKNKMHVIKSSQSPNFDRFGLFDLYDMKQKTIKIKSHNFPPEMRCSHIYGGKAKVCDNGCYFLEKGGEVSRWHCKDGACEGHVYCDNVRGHVACASNVEDREGIACFGKKGERMVCLEWKGHYDLDD